MIEAARAGDQEAAAQIVRTYWADAYRLAYLFSHDHGAAEEIAQDALLSAIRSIDSFEADRPFRPWLQRIAANASLDWLRRRNRRPKLVELDDALDPGSAAADVSDWAQGALPNELLDALSALDVDHRTAVVLRHVLDYEPVEIAGIIGVPVATVRTRVRRGLERMRTQLLTARGAREHERTR